MKTIRFKLSILAGIRSKMLIFKAKYMKIL